MCVPLCGLFERCGETSQHVMKYCLKQSCHVAGRQHRSVQSPTVYFTAAQPSASIAARLAWLAGCHNCSPGLPGLALCLKDMDAFLQAALPHCMQLVVAPFAGWNQAHMCCLLQV